MIRLVPRRSWQFISGKDALLCPNGTEGTTRITEQDQFVVEATIFRPRKLGWVFCKNLQRKAGHFPQLVDQTSPAREFKSSLSKLTAKDTTGSFCASLFEHRRNAFHLPCLFLHSPIQKPTVQDSCHAGDSERCTFPSKRGCGQIPVFFGIKEHKNNGGHG